MLFGQSLTVVGCIICAVAQNVATLIAGEAVVGLATGTIFVAYAGVPEMLPNKWRSVGLAILEGGIAVPWAIISVVLANALLEYSTWRWIFYIGIIIAVIALAGTALTYWPTPRPRGDYDKSRWDEVLEIDFPALFLFAGGLTTFLIGLTWGGSAAHPWNSAGTIAPIILGFFGTIGAFLYDAMVAKNPMFPSKLFIQFRQFSSLLVLVFIAGMTFYPMASLLPRGFLFMFTDNGIKIGVYALPNTILQFSLGVLCPLFAHKVGHVKWQLVFAVIMQATFLAASAASVYPNRKLAFIFLPAFGSPVFIWITILSYSIASLHVPHSVLGVAMGLIGTFRAAGGAVGNAIFSWKWTPHTSLSVSLFLYGHCLLPLSLLHCYPEMTHRRQTGKQAKQADSEEYLSSLSASDSSEYHHTCTPIPCFYFFNTVFEDRFTAYSGPAIAAAAVKSGLSLKDLPQIIPETIEYNVGVPGMLQDIPGITPAAREALRVAVRSAYGHAFRIVFYVTIPFSVIAICCSLFVEDPTTYMTNHVQFAMSKKNRSDVQGMEDAHAKVPKSEHLEKSTAAAKSG